MLDLIQNDSIGADITCPHCNLGFDVINLTDDGWLPDNYEIKCRCCDKTFKVSACLSYRADK